MRHRIIVAVILVSSVLLILARPHFAPTSYSEAKIVKGKVLRILSERAIEKGDALYAGVKKIQELLVEIKENGSAGRFEITNNILTLKEGDRIFLEKSADGSFVIVEFSRSRGILWLSVMFVALIFLISGEKGWNALVGLVFSFAVIIAFIVPRILNNGNPVSAALIGAMLILGVTLYASHGLNKKSISAFLGISITLLFVGLLSQYTVYSLHFTGFSNDDAFYLQQEVGEKLNLVALLVGGIIIAAIGVLDDIAITQASTVFTLSSVNPSMRRWKVFKKAMAVGKDHISAVINTLILAYTGAALPLVLLLSIGSDVQGSYVASIEIVAEEIVRTLISSSGLLLAVPLTTIISVLFLKQK